ncbi:MAG: hypothetical protein ABW224_15450 [Kibdelosporangium sp.]
MKWTRAVHHLEALAGECARLQPDKIVPLRVTQLWAFGQVVDSQADLDWARVALSVDLPAKSVPWLSLPQGASHWSRSARLRGPLSALWRSAHAPVWNHVIVRPVLLWDSADGIVEDAFAALRDGAMDTVRTAAPTPEQLRQRLADELAISLAALRGRVQNYDQKRWSPGKLEPVADELYAVASGYLDLLDG